MNELTVLSVENLSMKSNFEEAKKTLTGMLEEYKNLVVTEESLDSCKKDVTKLNKLETSINNRKKEVKKEASVEIVQFENGCKELMKMVSDVKDSLKKGTLEFEERRREEKKAKVLDFISDAITKYELNNKYSTQIGVLDKYLNVSTTLKSIKADIEEKAQLLKEAQDREAQNKELILNQIKATNEMLELNSPLTENDFSRFLRDTSTVNVAEAIAEINRVGKNRKDAEVEAVRKAEERRKREEERLAELKRQEEERKAEQARLAEEKRLEAERQTKIELTDVEEFAMHGEDDCPEFEPVEEVGFEPVKEIGFEPEVEPLRFIRIEGVRSDINAIKEYIKANYADVMIDEF